jgi:hypothetical protein
VTQSCAARAVPTQRCGFFGWEGCWAECGGDFIRLLKARVGTPFLFGFWARRRVSSLSDDNIVCVCAVSGFCPLVAVRARVSLRVCLFKSVCMCDVLCHHCADVMHWCGSGTWQRQRLMMMPTNHVIAKQICFVFVHCVSVCLQVAAAAPFRTAGDRGSNLGCARDGPTICATSICMLPVLYKHGCMLQACATGALLSCEVCGATFFPQAGGANQRQPWGTTCHLHGEPASCSTVAGTAPTAGPWFPAPLQACRPTQVIAGCAAMTLFSQFLAVTWLHAAHASACHF